MTKCRFCGAQLANTFANLGMSPLSNSYIPVKDADKGQMTYPLHARVCDKCFLVQLEEFESPEDIFSDYAYFSSYSSSWLAHAKKYVNCMLETYGVNKSFQVVEIASNDGYLLQYFKEKDIPVLGIEPAKNVAEVARRERNIPTISEFFGANLARKLRRENISANLLIGNNVLAHVPNINDFVSGMKILLADDGLITMEFPHLLNLIEQKQFDTIYHEHFSYLSLQTVMKIFDAHGLKIFDVHELPTHGGSLRIFACHKICAKYSLQDNVEKILGKEKAAHLDDLKTYLKFDGNIRNIKYDLLSLLIEVKRSGKKIIGYGAAAKGNTLLNYCGIGNEFIDFVADKNPHKQQTLLPGSRIPVFSPDKIVETKPNYVLILPWNLKAEIISQLNYIREWNGKFIIPIPEVMLL